MKILIIGSGGREHAILSKVLESKHTSKVYCAPGNAGMEGICELVAIRPEDTSSLINFAHKKKIDLTIVGPEIPLTLGIVDAFQQEGLLIFGPTKRASVLEGSKIFTKEFCERHNVPTAPFRVFDDIKDAKAYIQHQNQFPTVIKADGLAAGKGVVIAKDLKEAEEALTDMMLYEKFGDAGRKVVIEDFMPGEEASFIVITDGKIFKEFPTSQDHKRIFDHDEGPNTGGMGAYAPAPIVTESIRQKVIDQIIIPTLKGMAEEERDYLGFLYAGLMISDGEPRLVEYNCRLGDPETEVILPLLQGDFVELLTNTLEGKLDQTEMSIDSGACVCVVLTSGGYPGDFDKGFPISGLEKITDSDVKVFHAGTSINNQGELVTCGGRVLVVSAKGDDLASAIKTAYQSVPKITWSHRHYRKDIGAKGLKYETKDSSV